MSNLSHASRCAILSLYLITGFAIKKVIKVENSSVFKYIMYVLKDWKFKIEVWDYEINKGREEAD